MHTKAMRSHEAPRGPSPLNALKPPAARRLAQITRAWHTAGGARRFARPRPTGMMSAILFCMVGISCLLNNFPTHLNQMKLVMSTVWVHMEATNIRSAGSAFFEGKQLPKESRQLKQMQDPRNMSGQQRSQLITLLLPSNSFCLRLYCSTCRRLVTLPDGSPNGRLHVRAVSFSWIAQLPPLGRERNSE